MSNGDDQPQGGFDRFPRFSAGVGGGSLFDEPQHRVPPVPPPPGSVFEDPTIPVDRATYLTSEPARSRILEPEAWADESGLTNRTSRARSASVVLMLQSQ